MASFISIDWQVFKVTPLLATSFWNCLCTWPISSWRLFIFSDVHHVPIFDEYWFAEITDLTKSEKKGMVTVLQIICQKIVTPLFATSFWNCVCTRPISSWRLFIFSFCWNIFPISSSLVKNYCPIHLQSEMLNVHFLSKVIDVHHVSIFDEYWFAEKTDLTKSEKKVMVTVLQIITMTECLKDYHISLVDLSKGHDLDQVQFCGHISWHYSHCLL
jgi:hypothetical protein